MNIIKQEFKMSLKSLIGYTIGMMGIFMLFLSFFESFAKDTALLDKVMSNFPKEFKAALGFSDVPLSDINGFISFLITYNLLVASVFAMRLGISFVSEETRVKTADFLMTKPVKRENILTSKIITMMANIIIQNIVVFISIFLFMGIFKISGYNVKFLVLMIFSIFLVQLYFVSIGIFIGAVLKKIKSVMPVTLGVVFLFFVINMISESIGEVKMRYISPFSFYKGSDILNNMKYGTSFLIVNILMVIIFIVLGYFIYKKKDIHSI